MCGDFGGPRRRLSHASDLETVTKAQKHSIQNACMTRALVEGYTQHECIYLISSSHHLFILFSYHHKPSHPTTPNPITVFLSPPLVSYHHHHLHHQVTSPHTSPPAE